VIRFRAARVDEQAALEELQRRASLAVKAHRAALLAHPDAIELPVGQIEEGNVVVAESDGGVVGFAAVLWEGEAAELDGLFVEPAFWRQGIGRGLIDRAVALAVGKGAVMLRVVAGQEARGFYEAMGFVLVGEAVTRFGPALRMERVLSVGQR
jgi:GNAT superfamily N-acetyltransferase